MYKVIFLDDEAMTLKLLERAINWQKYHIDLGGSASDGEEGLALFRHVEPDIVITDIRMPGMNGIEFAGAIRQTQKQVKILLLSAYAEFEYARSAITYEISEYLLKPLDEDKLEAAIARIVQELDRERAVSSTIENYRLDQAEKQLQQLFINQGSINRNSRIPLPEEISAAFGSVDTLIHCLCVTEPHDLEHHSDVEAIRRFMKERLGPTTAAATISPVELIVLTTSLDPGQLEDVLDTLRHRARPVVAGVSPITPPFDLAEAYLQAESALGECFYAGKELCIYSAATSGFSSDIQLNLSDFEQPIAELVEQGKSAALIESLQDLLAHLFGRRLAPSLIFDFVFDVLNWVKIHITKHHRTVALAGLETINRDRLRACASSRSLVAYLNNLLQTIGAAVNNLLAADPGYFIVRRAKDYTRQHYTEAEFSLQDVAIYVGLSKNHFSQIFHKMTGQKYWDYVTQLRIEKAKEMLKQSNCSNSEICHAIGYESEFYFSKIFKRVVGVAAQQFRKM